MFPDCFVNIPQADLVLEEGRVRECAASVQMHEMAMSTATNMEVEAILRANHSQQVNQSFTECSLNVH
jgi:hypothetical protein